MKTIIFLFLLLTILIIACNDSPKKAEDPGAAPKSFINSDETFRHDYNLLKEHKDIIVLEKDSMKVLIVPAYQARVMTSASEGMDGLSYGWINHTLIDSGKYVPHINAYGGEERFWMGPEGGQFALFFKKGQPFDFKNWQTPAIMDTVTFNLVHKQSDAATFTKEFSIENYSGTTFKVTANRKIELLEKDGAEQILGIPFRDLKWVGYQTTNSITNTGNEDWNRAKGVLSIWLLSMMKASPDNTIIIPFKKGGGDFVNDSYFGKVPAERLKKKDSVLLFTADSKYRSKIGLPPAIVKPFAGSYDALRNVLTIIQFEYKGDSDYVNSMWEVQKSPYKGDVINAYNDGPNESGSQLGAFYELETSSPAVPLKKNQTLTHVQRIFHFEGMKEQMNAIARQLLGVDLNDL